MRKISSYIYRHSLPCINSHPTFRKSTFENNTFLAGKTRISKSSVIRSRFKGYHILLWIHSNGYTIVTNGVTWNYSFKENGVQPPFLLSQEKFLLRFNYVWSEAEFKEFEPQLEFKPRLKYIWFHKIVFKSALNWNRLFADLRRGSKSLTSASDKIILAVTRFRNIYGS